MHIVLDDKWRWDRLGRGRDSAPMSGLLVELKLLLSSSSYPCQRLSYVQGPTLDPRGLKVLWTMEMSEEGCSHGMSRLGS